MSGVSPSLLRAARAHAADGERLRRLDDRVASRLAGDEWGRALAPAEIGGGETPVGELAAAIVSLAEADGAAGWCGMIAATTSLIGGHLPAEWAERIFGEPRVMTGGFAAPVGVAREVDGGLAVEGRWSWGSGTHHCTWVGGGTRLVGEDGSPRPRPDGLAAPFVLFEREQVDLLDTWHVAGLRGTGSTDYEVRDALVPEGRWVQLGGAADPVVDRPLYRFSFFGALAVGVAAVTVGLARRAVQEIVDLAGAKKPQGSRRTLAERAVIQAEVAQAEAAVRSARALLDEAVGAAWSDAREGRVDDDHRVGLRLAATDATRRCASAVDRCYDAGGGASIHDASPLQRVFRDVHVATQHAMVAPRTYEVIGRHLVGLPTDLGQL